MARLGRASKYVVPALVAVVVLGMAGGYWFVRMHVRASTASVQSHVLGDHPGARVACEKRGSNGSSWLCGVIYPAESECVAVRVSVFGSVSTKPGHNRCRTVRAIARLVLPRTRARVQADAARLAGVSKNAVKCLHLRGTRTRWACLEATPGGVVCRVYQVARWEPWRTLEVAGACRRVPRPQVAQTAAA